jgi:hypothetical protein
VRERLLATRKKDSVVDYQNMKIAGMKRTKIKKTNMERMENDE